MRWLPVPETASQQKCDRHLAIGAASPDLRDHAGRGHQRRFRLGKQLPQGSHRAVAPFECNEGARVEHYTARWCHAAPRLRLRLVMRRSMAEA